MYICTYPSHITYLGMESKYVREKNVSTHLPATVRPPILSVNLSQPSPLSSSPSINFVLSTTDRGFGRQASNLPPLPQPQPPPSPTPAERIGQPYPLGSCPGLNNLVRPSSFFRAPIAPTTRSTLHPFLRPGGAHPDEPTRQPANPPAPPLHPSLATHHARLVASYLAAAALRRSSATASMSAAADMATAARPNGDSPSTPTPPEALSQPSSIPSTEGPDSPTAVPSSANAHASAATTGDAALKPEHHVGGGVASSQVIPSSLTPPPSSQPPQPNGAAAGQPLGYISSQRANIFSPPATAMDPLARRSSASTQASEYLPPTAEQISDAPPTELRSMFQSCLAENARLKMETAHHKLQYNLLSMQAAEDAKRAAVEHEITRREVQVLRVAEHSRQARRELSAAAEPTQAKYMQLKTMYEAAVDEVQSLRKRAKLAKRVIQQKQDELISLGDERDMLLTRIRENREHFKMLCSPGGAFHGALTPPTKTATAATPQQHRATPRQVPKTSHLPQQPSYQRGLRPDNDQNQAGFAALLQAVYQDNNSAPSTPTSANRPAPRMPPKHTRGVQSLSSLPETPNFRSRSERSMLLPSANLVPQSDPPSRQSVATQDLPATPTSASKRGRKSRESTISAEENGELDRAALASVAAATQSFMSSGNRASTSDPQRNGGGEEPLYESRASQAASEMLRRDPLESLEVASSVGSRDATPAPVDKPAPAKVQARLYAGVNKPGTPWEKRKHAGGTDLDESRRETHPSPLKKARYSSGTETERRVGLGIQYS